MSIYSYMVTIFGIIFWIFRLVITIMYTNGMNVPVVPLNTTIEIAIIFVTIPCLAFVLKRNVVGAVLYMGIYVAYFGTAIYNSINNIVDDNAINTSSQLDFIISVIGIVIAVLTFIDVLFNKHRKAIVGGNKSTDWYYKNEKYERNFDERADKNQYKIR